MVVKDHTFEKDVYKELDLVRRTYVNAWRWIKQPWVRRIRQPKLIHIYWWSDFYDAVWKTLDSNPLMHIILETIGRLDIRYFPIYSRKWKKYRFSQWKDHWWIWTYYNVNTQSWDYENNEIDLLLDEVVWWYPPILTWLFVNRPTDKRHGDILIYYIKQRHANQEKHSAETSDWGTESEGRRGTKKSETSSRADDG